MEIEECWVELSSANEGTGTGVERNGPDGFLVPVCRGMCAGVCRHVRVCLCAHTCAHQASRVREPPGSFVHLSQACSSHCLPTFCGFPSVQGCHWCSYLRPVPQQVPSCDRSLSLTGPTHKWPSQDTTLGDWDWAEDEGQLGLCTEAPRTRSGSEAEVLHLLP